MEITITRKIETAMDNLKEEFRSFHCIDEFKYKLEELYKSWNKSSKPSILKELYYLFDDCQIEYKPRMSYEYYKNLVYHSDIPTFSQLEDKLLFKVYLLYKEYPSPEDYMKRMVDRLCSDKDGWNNDTLRIRILKQFIKYGNYLSDAGFGGKMEIIKFVKHKVAHIVSENEEKMELSEAEILTYLDDTVFELLKTATKPQKKPNGKFGLLKLVNDLAIGQFYTNGKTKKSLYLFAMVYGMTYALHDTQNDDSADVCADIFKTDIETNLFRDYYTNNLIRFISKAYTGNLCEYELDPSGQGINYKNFAEMIYLYYIAKDCSRQDKIRLSEQMIKKVSKKQFKKGHIDTKKAGGTAHYRELFQKADSKKLFSEDIFSLDEEQFEDFICNNYNCDTYKKSYIKLDGRVIDLITPQIQMETKQESAFKAYKSIIKKLTEIDEIILEQCNYGLWFTDVAMFSKKGYNISNSWENVSQEEFNQFVTFLQQMNRFMGHTVKETIGSNNHNEEWKKLSKTKTKALYISSAEKVTRTSMIVAYYYYFNARHTREKNWKNFAELFEKFKEGIDKKLEEAYYQKFSKRNIFDVLVAFSSYAYINL